MNLMIGSDPETFAVDCDMLCVPPIILRRNGLSVIDVEYNKNGTPHPIFYKDDICKVMEDGVAVEFTIKPEAEPSKLFKNFKYALDVANNLLSNFRLSAFPTPAVDFDFIGLGLDDKDEDAHNACIFGCDPSLNIYTGEFSKIETVVTLKHRFGGGHIHISPLPHKLHVMATKLLDIFVGTTIVMNTTDIEKEKLRNKYYGQPGTIRLQDYPDGSEGIEYRPPSVTWITNPITIEQIYKDVYKVIELINDPVVGMSYINELLEPSKQALDTYDVELANTISGYIR